MSTQIPSELNVRTRNGTFNVKITPFQDRDTNKIESYTISLGGQKDKCVQILVPTEEGKEGKLIWVESNGTCYLELTSKNKLMQHLIHLGFTLARKINPLCHRYVFDDCSSFPCELPNGKKYTVSMKPFHIAFHGETWYEKYFGAKLVRGQEEYERGKRNLYDSAKKPKTFDFVNPELQELLTPIYNSTTTWYAFFEEISENYGSKKCSIVYPWIVSALIHVFDGSNIFEHIKWYLDLSENKAAEKTPMIEYRSITRGGRKTRKYRRKTNENMTPPIPPVYIMNIPMVKELRYIDYVSK